MIKGITGAHWLLYSTDPEADRAFFRDVLGWRGVDAGGDSGGDSGSWLIFALPDSELGVHPGDGTFVQQHADQNLMGALLYLMCDDIEATVASFKQHDVPCTPIDQEEWGRFALITLPSGGKIGVYQPSHPTAI